MPPHTFVLPSRTLIAIFAALPLLSPSVIRAEESNTSTSSNSLNDLSLEELLKLQVSSVASKKEQKVSDAPGMVTVFSSKDMEQTGYYTLFDLANITAGYGGNTWAGSGAFETRGLSTGNSYNNNKHLVLIDEIPVSFVRSGGAPIENEFPLFFADRVEFLKGAASALYGTGAFLGVVNVVPKRLEKNGTLSEAKVMGGNLNDQKRIMANVLTKGENGSSRVSFGVYHNRNSLLVTNPILANSNPLGDNYRLRDREDDVFASFSHTLDAGVLSGFELGFLYMQRLNGMHDHFDWNGLTGFNDDKQEYMFKSMVPYAKYARKLNDDWSLNAYLKYEHSQEADFGILVDPSGPLIQPFNIYFAEVGSQVEATYKISTAMNLIFGLDFDSQSGSGQDAAIPPDQGFDVSKTDTLYTYSAYGQYTYNTPWLLQGTDLIAGLRLDNGRYGSAGYTQVSPRVGIVQKITDQVDFKLLYGSALRAPTLKERSLNANLATSKGIIADGVDTNVQPEKIQTFDIGASYQSGSLMLQAAYFFTWITDEIFQDFVDSSSAPGLTAADAAYSGVNLNRKGTTRSHGVEIEGRYASPWGISAMVSLAAAKASLAGSELPQSGMPAARYDIGLGYHWNVPTDLTANVIYRGVTTYYVDASTVNVPKGWQLMDANLTGKVTENIRLELMVRNLLNQEVRLPGLGRGGEATYPLWGRTFEMTLAMRI